MAKQQSGSHSWMDCASLAISTVFPHPCCPRMTNGWWDGFWMYFLIWPNTWLVGQFWLKICDNLATDSSSAYKTLLIPWVQLGRLVFNVCSSMITSMWLFMLFSSSDKSTPFPLSIFKVFLSFRIFWKFYITYRLHLPLPPPSLNLPSTLRPTDSTVGSFPQSADPRSHPCH